MKKVEIEFATDFESDVAIPMPLGRFPVGRHVARYVLCTDGVTRLALPAEAKDDGSILWAQRAIGVQLYGFGKGPPMFTKSLFAKRKPRRKK